MIARRITRYLSIATALLCVFHTANAVTVRFEAESTGAVKDQGDAVGYDSINGVVGRSADPTASNGEILFTGGNDRNFKMVFVGTGVDLISRQDMDGGDFDWILDEGAMMGSGTTFGGSRVDQAVFPLVSGLPNTLHTLELRRKSSGILRPDAFDVHDAGSQTRYEQDDPAISYSPTWFSTSWTFDDALAEASGGSMAVSISKGDMATLNFKGTAVVILADVRGDGGILDYDINNGALTGSIDLRAQNKLLFGNWHRWPILITNSLPFGNHTLKLTAREANSGGRGAVTLDTIDVFGVPEPSTLSLLGVVVAGAFGLGRCTRRK